VQEDHIPFNRPFLTGKEAHYIYQAVYSGKLSGNGIFTQKCQSFFEKKYGFKKCLLTSSCTDALEMCALLLNFQQGDEVIMPSYTFVSTANAFMLRGAKIMFADSCRDHPNVSFDSIVKLVTSKTKAIVLVHYAGQACEMEKIVKFAKGKNIVLIEDAAQAIDSYYDSKPLGSFGALATFSFHETKNVISGEGGMLVINDEKLIERAEIIWEKGTNRAAFFRGEIDKYGWVDIGSSFLPSEIIAAFLYAQIENLESIQNKRVALWNYYGSKLRHLSESSILELPKIKDLRSNNGHIFYVVCKNLDERTALLKHLNKNKINAVFHYISLHSSAYFMDKHDGVELPNSDRFTNCLLRLPLHLHLKEKQIDHITEKIVEFYLKR